MKVVAVVRWEEAGRLKPQYYHFRKPTEWRWSPFRVILLAKGSEFADKSFNDRPPAHCFTVGRNQSAARFSLILGERKVSCGATEIREKIG